MAPPGRERGEAVAPRRSGATGALVLLVVSLISASASASPAAKLTYLRGPGAERCPDEAALRQAVAARLGYDVFFPWARRTVVAEIRRDPRAFRARLQIVSEAGLVLGTRAIAATSDDCGEVVRALALAVSIAVDDFGLDDVPPPDATPAIAEEKVAPPPEATVAPAPPPTKAPDSPPPPSRRFATSLAVESSFGLAPAQTVGMAAGVELLAGPASLGLELRADLPASGDGGRIDTFVAAASLAPCLRSRFLFYGCALVMVGDFHESGNVLHSRSGDGLLVALGPRVGFEQPLGTRFGIFAHVDGLFIATRQAVSVDGSTVFTLPVFAPTAAIGGRVRF